MGRIAAPHLIKDKTRKRSGRLKGEFTYEQAGR